MSVAGWQVRSVAGIAMVLTIVGSGVRCSMVVWVLAVVWLTVIWLTMVWAVLES